MKIIYILRPALAALLLLAAGAEAAVPRLINFQGKLSDSGGEAVTAPVSMVFKIYTAASGGAPVWTETQTVTPDTSGVYSVMLGMVTPLDISFSIPYWLGVTVGADSEMLPRYRMASSPYALNSSTAAWAEGADWPSITNKPALTIQGNVFNGVSQLVQLLGDGKLPAIDGSNLTGLPTASLADGSVTTVKLADGAVTDAKVSLSTAAISSGQFGDNRVAISTQALSGGVYNQAGRLVQVGADGFLPALSGVNLTGLTKAQVGLGSVDNTSDADKPVSTAQLAALNLKANLAGAVFTGAISASNLSGTNTGDQTDIAGNAATVTNGVYTTGSYANPAWLTSLATAKIDLSTVTAALASINLALSTAVYTTGDQTIGGVKTFSNPILGNITGNAATVTTNANLTGVVTSLGNATSIGAGAITNLMLANTAVANLSGVNTGDQTNITGNAATVTNGVYTTGLYANPAWLTSLATAKIDLSTVTAALTGIQLTLSTAVYTTGDQTIGGVKTFSNPILGNITGNAATVTTNANLTGVVTSVGNATSIGAGAITNLMLANTAVANLSGVNTGDQTNITGNAATVTNGVYTTGLYANPAWLTSLATAKIDLSTVTAALASINLALSTAVYTTGDQTIGGVKTFSSPIVGSITGNAATVTTNANLTGVVTSVGNATSIGAGAITNAMLANTAVANLSGVNTGDQTDITGNAATVTDGVYTTGLYANPAWLTSLATAKIDLSTVTAALASINLALSTAVYTVGDQTIGGVKTFSSPIVGSITGNAATADTAVKSVNIAGGSIGQLPYQTAADTTGLLAAGLAGQVLYSNGAAAPSWGTLAAGDVYKASTQTFTGLNTFTSTITAKGFANLSQSIVLGSVTTFAADGSGVVLMTFNGTGNVATISGCSSGAVGQGQRVTFVVSAWTVGGISFADTAPASAAPDTLLLDGAAGTWTPDASAVSLGSTITLLCTTVNTHKLWVEVGRSISGS